MALEHPTISETTDSPRKTFVFRKSTIYCIIFAAFTFLLFIYLFEVYVFKFYAIFKRLLSFAVIAKC